MGCIHVEAERVINVGSIVSRKHTFWLPFHKHRGFLFLHNLFICQKINRSNNQIKEKMLLSSFPF